MPVNNNALFRYRILDRCFSNKFKNYTIGALLDEVNKNLIELNGKGISERQLRADIQKMRERLMFDAPIVAVPFEGKRCYYHYLDPDFSIFKSELSDEDLKNLHSTIEMLGKYRGIPANAWLEEVISNLEYRFGVKANSENLVSFGQNDNLRGLEFLSDIIEYTINHQPVLLRYKTYDGKESESILHPYYVKQYNGRWFILGCNEAKKQISNYALDRVQSIKPVSIEFKNNETIDFKQYFSEIIGVTYPNEKIKKENIVLRFSKKRFPYVESKPIHQSQRITNSTRCEIEIEVRPNKELCQQIFSFIPDVEVVSPQWFRDDIKRKIEENLKIYGAMQNGCIEK
jgi:predicted DNA-binding transcriptional regulator YafY